MIAIRASILKAPPRLRSIMAKETPELEIKRLLTEQTKTRQDEVFGGLSPAERAAYNEKTKRINELEIELAALAAAKKSRRQAKADQSDQWNKESETDTPQSEARQSYRSREGDSANYSTDSTKKGKGKSQSEEKGSE
jgi:hypothetical protein